MEVKDGKGVRHRDFRLVAAGKVDDGLGLLVVAEGDDDDDADGDDDSDSESGDGDDNGDANGDDGVLSCSGLEGYWWPFGIDDDCGNESVEVVDVVRGEVATADCRWLS